MPDEKNNPDPPGGRPIPEKPRGKNKDMKIFALLVGIDDYQGEVSSLNGCLKDVELVKSYLVSKYGKDEEGNSIAPILSPLDKERADDAIQVESLGRLHICSLTDALATYDNVIRAFEEFFINENATAEDSFWFHFSGHGTEQYTASEFYQPEEDGVKLPSLVPNGKDQSLVCYNADGGLEGTLLADKELAVLISNVYTQVRRLNEKQKPHIVVSIDCCHAGTATRGDDDDFQVRMFRDEAVAGFRDWEEAFDEENIRSIGSYYKGHYDRQMGDEENRSAANLNIPQAPHILLSGAHSLEKAGDTGNGGFFTKNLIQVLSKPKGYNYVDLFNQTRNLVKKENKKQTPQFEPVSSFDPYTRFLEGWEDSGNIGLYPVRSNTKGTRWFVRCGAVNGLPANTAEEIQVIVRNADTKEAVGNAFITKVGVQDSRLELGFALEQEPATVTVGQGGARGTATGDPRKILRPHLSRARNHDDSEGEAVEIPALVLDADTQYVAQLYRLPADPFFINDLVGLASKLESLEEEEQSEISRFLIELQNFNIHISSDADETTEASLQVVEKDGEMVIQDVTSEIDAYTIDQSLSVVKQLNKLLSSIEKIVRWKRMLALENPNTQLKDYFSAELQVADQALTTQDAEAFESFPFGDISMVKTVDQFIKHDTGDDILHYLRFRLKLNFADKKNTENLYFYLFNMREDAAIESVGPKELRIENTNQQDVAFYPVKKLEEVGGEAANTLVSELVLPEEVNNEAFFFKLLVTKQQILFQQLEQTGLDGDRGIVGISGTSELKDDWCFMTMRLAVEKRS